MEKYTYEEFVEEVRRFFVKGIGSAGETDLF